MLWKMQQKLLQMYWKGDIRKKSGIRLSSYFDFAENDFKYFKASYEDGIVEN